MRLLLATLAAAAPVPHGALLAIDAQVGYRNFLPARMLAGFAYRSWSYRGATLRVEFRNRAGLVLEWRVQPLSGTCDAGRQASYQLGGNKVWWARRATEQVAWRCVFDQAGKPLRLAAASSAPASRVAGVGLGTVVAHARRY